MRKKRKGQAAIEFLTTYSWAIMGILLTIGALTYFDIFNTERFISERCETGAQISCVEAALGDDGTFYIRLTNNYPVNITINSISLNSDYLSGEETTTYPTRHIPRGQTDRFDVSAGSGITTNNRESFDITISFSRQDGTNSYDIKGNAVVRRIDSDLIPTP